MNNKDTHLSKSLSWILRHGAIKEGFDISCEGYIPLITLLKHTTFEKYREADIIRVVKTSDKQRFALRFNDNKKVWEIKANQGHSIQEISNEGLVPLLQPKYRTVIHGTYLSSWQHIKCQGLSRMKRQHIHFAKGVFGDPIIISGIRKDAQVLIYVDLSKALTDGLKFYESVNGVILTEGNANGYLKSKYFQRVISIPSGMAFVFTPSH